MEAKKRMALNLYRVCRRNGESKEKARIAVRLLVEYLQSGN